MAKTKKEVAVIGSPNKGTKALAGDEVRAMVEISEVVALTPADVETRYNSAVGQVSTAEKTAGTETEVRRFSPKDVADMVGIHAPAGGGGGLSRSVDNPAAVDGLTIQVVRLGGATPVTLGGNKTDGYDIVIPAGAEVLQLDIDGSSATANASGELVLKIDNSANGYNRRWIGDIEDNSNDQDVDEPLVGNIIKQQQSAFVNTLTVPNIAGSYPTGFTLSLR